MGKSKVPRFYGQRCPYNKSKSQESYTLATISKVSITCSAKDKLHSRADYSLPIQKEKRRTAAAAQEVMYWLI